MKLRLWLDGKILIEEIDILSNSEQLGFDIDLETKDQGFMGIGKITAHEEFAKKTQDELDRA